MVAGATAEEVGVEALEAAVVATTMAEDSVEEAAEIAVDLAVEAGAAVAAVEASRATTTRGLLRKSLVEFAFLSHLCQDDLVCKVTEERVPSFNAPLYLENKQQIGKVDEIFGPTKDFVAEVDLEEGGEVAFVAARGGFGGKGGGGFGGSCSFHDGLAEAKKEEGNELYKQKKYEDAIKLHTEAIGAANPACFTAASVRKQAVTSEAGDEQLPRALSPQEYARIMELEEQDIVPSMEAFECSVCFSDVGPGEGALLKDCLHMFCRACLYNAVRYAEEAMVKCPFRNEEYSCSSHLQEREIKALVPPEVYEYHLSQSLKTAESQAPNSFHCKTADCPGWCVLEGNVNVFTCPVCHHSNCLTCRAIHEGKNCLQYQDELDFNSPNGHDARQTKNYLDNMVKEGQAMHCPQCQVI
ncbi:hypothetical protein HPB47_023171, partial [Ixodes persulcatus]